MTAKQQKLHDALKRLEAVTTESQEWIDVQSALDELANAIQEGLESYDASFPPEIDRLMDAPALETANMYDWLERAGKGKQRKKKAIRKALGYTYP